jgi:hypothetical protein
MARFVYIDETGADGKKQPILTLAAVLVDEEMVQPLSEGMRKVALDHLGRLPPDFEFHGKDVWHGKGYWSGKPYADLIAAYEAAIALLGTCNISVAHSSIDKPKLSARYGGAADANAYVLALQFLLEKVDRVVLGRKVLVADEAKEHELRAVKMVADMQEWVGGGVVPGRKLKTIIDSLHYVSSQASSGVQMADLVAFILQRRRREESHPLAQAALDRLGGTIDNHRSTWRDTWPA